MANLWGLCDKGFVAKDFSSIKADVEAALVKEVDPSLRFSSDTIVGQITDIVSYEARVVWEAMMGLYHSLRPDSASGSALDALCSLTGTYRRKAMHSKAKVLLTLESKASLTQGCRIKTIAGDIFELTAPVKNESSIRSQIEADVRAETPGKIIAAPNTQASITTPVAGWLQVSIKNTYEIGCLDETDEELRLRRLDELKAAGVSTCDGITARLIKQAKAQAVYIKDNKHSFEVVVKGGREQDIARAIWLSKPLGVESTGKITSEVTDSLGQKRKVKFSRPEEITLNMQADVKVARLLTDEEQVSLKNNLVDYANEHFKLGAEVYPSRFYGSILENPLILDINSLQLKQSSSGQSAPFPINDDQIPVLEFKDIFIKQIVGVL